MGADVTLENRALGAVAKASVVWLGREHHGGDLHQVGLQLHQAQNVWGIEFPPDDWHAAMVEAESAPVPGNLPAAEQADTVGAETQVSSLAGEEITIRLLQELQEAADAHVQEFRDRLKQLTHQLGSELELELRAHAATAKKREVGPLEEEIKVLRKSLSAASKEIGKLEARIQELKGDLQATTENPPLTPLKEAHQQLTALSNSVVESMNRAADTGLREYRILLQKENQESAARLLRAAEQNPRPPKSALSGS
jgi:predicted RNase H-like nuclease (RuvC/YqgF family)